MLSSQPQSCCVPIASKLLAVNTRPACGPQLCEIVQLVLLAASQALNSNALRTAARGRASVGETHALLLRRRLLGSDDSGGRSLRLAVQLQLTHFRLQAQSDGPHRNRARSAPTGGSAQADPIRRRRMLQMHVRRRCRRAHDNRLRESTHARVLMREYPQRQRLRPQHDDLIDKHRRDKRHHLRRQLRCLSCAACCMFSAACCRLDLHLSPAATYATNVPI